MAEYLMLTKPVATRYSACMRFFLVFSLSLLLFSPTLSMAEDAVLPPPSVDASDGQAADDDAFTDERAPNLRDELKAPDTDSNVDVRSYKRKDGAKVTEYSLNGQIYEIKVQPVGGLPAYYMYRNKAGHFERRRPGGQPYVTPPSWILKKF